MKASLLTLSLTALATLGGEVLAQGTTDRALQCNGTTDYLATSALLSITNDFTIEAWINPAEPHQIDGESNAGYAGMEGQHYVIYPSHGLHSWSRGHAGVGISAGTNGVSVYEHAEYYIPATLVYQGDIKGWTHVAVVYRDRQPSLYVNGALVRTGLKSAQGLVHPCAGENAKPQRNMGGIGGGYYGYFKGGIDNVRIWDQPLSEKEIRGVMYKTLTAAPHLALNYDMNRTGQGSGLPVNDRTGSTAQLATTYGTSATPIFTLRESTPLAPSPALASESDATRQSEPTARVGEEPATPVNHRFIPEDVDAGTGAEKKDATVAAEAGGAVLEAARPNPFTEGTTIAYALPSKGMVRIEVYDAAGRLVGTPVDGERSAGRHEIRLDGSMFPASGAYLCRMSWNGTALTRTMTVVR